MEEPVSASYNVLLQYLVLYKVFVKFTFCMDLFKSLVVPNLTVRKRSYFEEFSFLLLDLYAKMTKLTVLSSQECGLLLQRTIKI